MVNYTQIDYLNAWIQWMNQYFNSAMNKLLKV